MTEPGQQNTGSGTSPPPGPGRLLRASLPASPADWVVYAGLAAALRLVLHQSIPVVIAVTAATIVIGIAITAASRYHSARARHRADSRSQGADSDG